MNMITVGKDNCSLFPVIIEVNQGVCVSQSNITGNFILSGRAAASSEDSLMNNRTVMNNKQSVSADVPRKIDDQDKLGVQRTGATEDKRVLTEISTDSINVPPVKRCVKCVGCKNCKKVHLPNQARQLAQAEIVKKSLSFENEFYKASYPHN
jgi:hypothetical protein